MSMLKASTVIMLGGHPEVRQKRLDYIQPSGKITFATDHQDHLAIHRNLGRLREKVVQVTYGINRPWAEQLAERLHAP